MCTVSVVFPLFCTTPVCNGGSTYKDMGKESEEAMEGKQTAPEFRQAVPLIIFIALRVGLATGYRLDSRGLIPASGKIFLFSTASRSVLESTQPPIQWVPRAISPGVK
jgi:hypothetical protein